VLCLVRSVGVTWTLDGRRRQPLKASTAVKMLTYARPEVKTITAVYKVSPRRMVADVNGVAHEFLDRIWGLIQDVAPEGMIDPQLFVGIVLVPRQDHLRRWRYVAARAASPAPG
jgi:hypothetical protein